MASVSGTISSAGIGSGLDVTSLVSSLVAAERTPDANRISKAQAVANVKISALGAFKSSITSLQTAAGALESTGSLAKVAATTSDNTIATATATGGTPGGFYDLEVVSLARGSKRTSATFTNAATSVGTGTVTIGVGTASFTVTLASGADKLTDLRDAINSAGDNKGVNASIVSDSGGAHLVLTSRSTGLANAISVSSASSADGSDYFTTTETQPALDAHIRVDGGDVYSATNTVSNAIDGVTLNLVKAAPGTTVALTLAADTKSAATSIQQFVNMYNAVVMTVAAQTKYDPTAQTAGALLGDAAVASFMNQLRGVVGNAASGTGSAYSTLSALGISTQKDGTLKVDTDKLNSAIAADSGSVQKLFGADSGYAQRIDDLVDSFVKTGGLIQTETDGLNGQLKDLQKQSDALNVRMDTVEARYKAQFTALDTLISQLKSTQDFLTQQLSSLSNLANASVSKG